MFADGAGAAGAGLAASLHRPLLAIFDRNFELSVMLQHAWTYKPLVHDVLGMRLNRVTLAAPGGAPGAGTHVPKTFEVDDSDFFWSAHGREQFPKIAEQVEAELARYRAAVDELNRSAGSNVLDAAADPADLMAGNTKHLMSAINSLPGRCGGGWGGCFCTLEVGGFEMFFPESPHHPSPPGPMARLRLPTD